MALAAIVALGLAWLAAVVFFRINRIWLLFYLVGSVGLAFIIIFAGRALPVEQALERYVAMSLHEVTVAAGIPTQLFQAAPGSLLVLVIRQDIGWTVVQITIECSGLLETGVMLGMLLFYPGWSFPKKAALAMIGIAATFAANQVRLFFIVLILHSMGKDSIFIAHTIMGRAIFFIMTVGIYWYVLTRPTLRSVRHKLETEMTQ